MSGWRFTLYATLFTVAYFGFGVWSGLLEGPVF
jgi:hypothetical protein